MIYFISGASGSGKTSCIPYLKKLLPHILTYDFDEIGVPPNPSKSWRQESTEAWLQKCLTEKNKDVCLFGQMVLGEILACPSAPHLEHINYCLLDCRDIVRIKRLKGRRDPPTQDMLNWAAWLRVHHIDPVWQQHVIKEGAWSKLNFQTWDKSESWDNFASIKIIDTTFLSLSQLASLLADWIKLSSVRVDKFES